MDCSPQVSVQGISQTRILEWVAISFSRGSSQPRGRSALAGGLFITEPPGKPIKYYYCPPIDRGRNWGMVKLNLLPKVTDFKWQCRKSKLGSPISYAKPPLFSTALMLTFFLIRSENMLHFLRNPTWRSKVSPGVKAGMRLWARESYSRGDVTWGNRSRSDHEGNERNQQRYTDSYEGKKSENY